jgi:hypothetical protein
MHAHHSVAISLAVACNCKYKMILFMCLLPHVAIISKSKDFRFTEIADYDFKCKCQIPPTCQLFLKIIFIDSATSA